MTIEQETFYTEQALRAEATLSYGQVDHIWIEDIDIIFIQTRKGLWQHMSDGTNKFGTWNIHRALTALIAAIGDYQFS